MPIPKQQRPPQAQQQQNQQAVPQTQNEAPTSGVSASPQLQQHATYQQQRQSQQQQRSEEPVKPEPDRENVDNLTTEPVSTTIKPRQQPNPQPKFSRPQQHDQESTVKNEYAGTTPSSPTVPQRKPQQKPSKQQQLPEQPQQTHNFALNDLDAAPQHKPELLEAEPKPEENASPTKQRQQSKSQFQKRLSQLAQQQQQPPQQQQPYLQQDSPQQRPSAPEREPVAIDADSQEEQAQSPKPRQPKVQKRLSQQQNITKQQESQSEQQGKQDQSRAATELLGNKSVVEENTKPEDPKSPTLTRRGTRQKSHGAQKQAREAEPDAEFPAETKEVSNIKRQPSQSKPKAQTQEPSEFDDAKSPTLQRKPSQRKPQSPSRESELLSESSMAPLSPTVQRKPQLQLQKRPSQSQSQSQQQNSKPEPAKKAIEKSSEPVESESEPQTSVSPTLNQADNVISSEDKTKSPTLNRRRLQQKRNSQAQAQQESDPLAHEQHDLLTKALEEPNNKELASPVMSPTQKRKQHHRKPDDKLEEREASQQLKQQQPQPQQLLPELAKEAEGDAPINSQATKSQPAMVEDDVGHNKLSVLSPQQSRKQLSKQSAAPKQTRQPSKFEQDEPLSLKQSVPDNANKEPRQRMPSNAQVSPPPGDIEVGATITKSPVQQRRQSSIRPAPALSPTAFEHNDEDAHTLSATSPTTQREAQQSQPSESTATSPKDAAKSPKPPRRIQQEEQLLRKPQAKTEEKYKLPVLPSVQNPQKSKIPASSPASSKLPNLQNKRNAVVATASQEKQQTKSAQNKALQPISHAERSRAGSVASSGKVTHGPGNKTGRLSGRYSVIANNAPRMPASSRLPRHMLAPRGRRVGKGAAIGLRKLGERMSQVIQGVRQLETENVRLRARVVRALHSAAPREPKDPESEEAKMNMRYAYEKKLDAERARVSTLEGENRGLVAKIKELELELTRTKNYEDPERQWSNQVAYWRSKCRDGLVEKYKAEDILARVQKRAQNEARANERLRNEIDALTVKLKGAGIKVQSNEGADEIATQSRAAATFSPTGGEQARAENYVRRAEAEMSSFVPPTSQAGSRRGSLNGTTIPPVSKRSTAYQRKSRQVNAKVQNDESGDAPAMSPTQPQQQLSQLPKPQRKMQSQQQHLPSLPNKAIVQS